MVRSTASRSLQQCGAALQCVRVSVLCCPCSSGGLRSSHEHDGREEKGLHACRSWCLSLPREGCSGFVAQREHSFSECRCRSSQRGWDPSGMPSAFAWQLPVTPLLDCRDRSKRTGRGPLVPAVVQTPRASCSAARCRPWAGRRHVPSLGQPAQTTNSTLALACPEQPAGLTAAVTLQSFQPCLARLIFISHGWLLCGSHNMPSDKSPGQGSSDSATSHPELSRQRKTKPTVTALVADPQHLVLGAEEL